jgi:predicted transcriptional regulator
MAGAGAVWVQQKDYIDVGEALAHACERAGLTQQEVTRFHRKAQSFASNYERGQRRIVLELIRIVDVRRGGCGRSDSIDTRQARIS